MSWPESTKVYPQKAFHVGQADNVRLVEKLTGNFYDLEFCMWLQANFDRLLIDLEAR